jgi:NAD(P)-dependent dehydrogenase (short-subunit alcohol dehydrogenase family)
LRSLAFDAAAIDGPVVLVGHSQGGAVITQAPGLMALNDVDPSVDNEHFKAQRSQGIALGRLATTDEVADAALFLASGLSSFTTGAACPSTAATTRSNTARKAS